MPRFSARERAEFLTIKATCYRGLGRAELLAYLGERLGPFLKADATCMVELDPPTGYPIYVVSREWPEENHRPLIEHALLASPAADPGRLVLDGLRSVNVESRVSDGGWRRDPYFQYHVLLYGYRHELQVACATGSRGRALLTITRKESTGQFDPGALSFLDAIAPHVAAAMRAATIRESLAAPAGSGTGFILLDEVAGSSSRTRSANGGCGRGRRPASRVTCGPFRCSPACSFEVCAMVTHSRSRPLRWRTR